MKQFKLLPKLYLSTALLACGLWFGGCSKSNQDEVKPVSVVAHSDFSVVDGRLVFKDSDAHVRTLEKLKSMSQTNLALWEKELNFSSLRAGDAKGELALKEEFGFPSFVAATINRKGEYQAGNKFYWFHNHQLHEFNSLADLELAQRGQNVKHEALNAGMIKLKAPVAQRLIGPSAPRDGRYQSDFCLGGNCGSRRKIVYETWAYYQQLNAFPTYYTVVVLSTKLEYYSRDGWKNAGDTRSVNVQLGGTAKLGAVTSTICDNQVNISWNGTTNGNVDFTVSACQISGFDPSQMYWDFTLNGTISSFVAGYQSQTYTVQGNNLW